MVRQRDDDWMMIVKWTLYAMINAEELGVNSKNIDEALKSKKPDVMRLMGTEGHYGEDLGLTKDWAARIIRHVGNYGEVYERNVGAELQAEDPARTEPALERRRHPVRAADQVTVKSSLRGAIATKQSRLPERDWIASRSLSSGRASRVAMTAANNSASAPAGRRGNSRRRTIPRRPARAS